MAAIQKAIGPIALYHYCALATAFDPQYHNAIVKRTGGNVRIRWGCLPKQPYQNRVRAHIRALGEEFSADVEDLAREGVSEYAASLFLEYLRGDIIELGGTELCNYGLGCPANDPDGGYVPTIHHDHPLPQSQRGIETQTMCAYHNRLKQDNPLLDHLFTLELVGPTEG
jgi:hypothetical protein